MTPGARIAAAIDVLDRILAGEPAEKVLTLWGRDNRYAGSGDRQAVRDHVFDALRRRRSYAARGGAETGRGIMLGACRAAGRDPATWFSGQGHAPAILTDAEQAHVPPDMADPVRLDLPDWLWPQVSVTLGAQTEEVLRVLQNRAPVQLRVNLAKTDRETAIAVLARDGIVATPHPDVKTAIQVIENERKVKISAAFEQGLVELQDAASQAAVLRLPLHDGERVLDYCAGGGGKSLAMAARARLKVFAHDADPRRMADLPARSLRAGVAVTAVSTAGLRQQAPFDLVLTDAPCSGSGTWRRSPDAKWRLTPQALDQLVVLQADILDQAAGLVASGGKLAYATCSILDAENASQISAFLTRADGWVVTDEMRLLPGPLHDGFYLAVMSRT
jgi:16S rRNA (cytosine967-C5)-methyltransferase